MLSGPILEPLSGGKAKSAAIILHGLGDSGAGLIDLGEVWRQGLPDTVFLAPNAPFPCDYVPFGYQWFRGDNWEPSVVLEGIKRAAPYLHEFIDHVMATYELPPERVALVGFSQGTMMSLYVGPRREKNLAGVLGYSGALIGGELLPGERKSSPPVFLVHGMLDNVVPFSALQHAVSGLQNVNINVTCLACPDVFHNIDNKGLSEGLAFLRRILL